MYRQQQSTQGRQVKLTKDEHGHWPISVILDGEVLGSVQEIDLQTRKYVRQSPGGGLLHGVADLILFGDPSKVTLHPVAPVDPAQLKLDLPGAVLHDPGALQRSIQEDVDTVTRLMREALTHTIGEFERPLSEQPGTLKDPPVLMTKDLFDDIAGSAGEEWEATRDGYVCPRCKEHSDPENETYMDGDCLEIECPKCGTPLDVHVQVDVLMAAAVADENSTLFEMKPSCGHVYRVKGVCCTEETMPSCHCGGVLKYNLEDMRCPTCKVLPGFMERPVWQHMGEGIANMPSLMKLELYSGPDTFDRSIEQLRDDPRWVDAVEVVGTERKE